MFIFIIGVGLPFSDFTVGMSVQCVYGHACVHVLHIQHYYVQNVATELNDYTIQSLQAVILMVAFL